MTTAMPPGGMPPPGALPPKYCHACGAVLDPRAEICPRCGVRQFLPGGRSRMAAALFALFLGSLGIHKFYLGKIWQGVLYLLFCWTMIPAIAGIIEGIIYLTMSDADFAAKYG
jgi:ribosomal protein L40E